MAEIVGMLAAGALKVAAGKMAEAVGDQIKDRIMLQRRFAVDLEDMEDTVESIQAVLEDAERRSIRDASVRLWLKRLTRASGDIADIFDEHEVNKTRKSFLRKLKILEPCFKYASEVSMASKMMEVREKLEKISNHHHKFSFMAGSSSNVQQIIDDELATSSEMIQTNFVGRKKEKQKLIQCLTTSSTSPDQAQAIILPIFGFGGMGKTTLARELFNDTHFKDYKKAWIYVGQTFGLTKIKECIESKLQEQRQVSNRQEVDTDLSTSANKKVLIVLDDLWEKEEENWSDLKEYLNMLGNGHKLHVIVTTRDGRIAQDIKTTEEHKIKELSPDACWKIIKQIAGFKDKDQPDKSLEDIGMEIAKKCRGVALAARAIGYTLRSRNEAVWVSVKDSDIWNVSTSGYTSSSNGNVLASLKLSYSSMPPYLRLCFAYCATFPKDHMMSKAELIYQWEALGFIKPSDKFNTWQHGEDCIKRLLEMSFLETSKLPSNDWEQRKDTTLFTMHDLVHNVARSIMEDEVFFEGKNSKPSGRKYCYAVLKDPSKPLNLFLSYPKKIRALRFLGNGEIEHCHAKMCSTTKYLRILDLGKCSSMKLPSSIDQLRLLRYLNAPEITDQEIPRCLTKLSKLLYLNLSGSRNLLELPESIGRMESLTYINLSGCVLIQKLPESFGMLQNLVHLDFSKCKGIRRLPETFGQLKKLAHLDVSECEGIRMLPDSFEKLENLVHLDLSKCGRIEMLPKLFGKLENLVHLDLSYCSGLNATTATGALCNLRKVQYLNLSHCSWLHKELQEVIGKLSDKLQYLNLSKCLGAFPCWFGENSDDIGSLFDKISTLSNLEHLDLSYNSTFVTLPDSFCSLRKLHTLDLNSCRSLRKLPGNMEHMKNLRFLITNDCMFLDESTLPVNRNLIPLPNFIVHAAEGESNLIRLKDASPRELVIRRLENVKSAEEGHGIELKKKESLLELTLDWTRGTKRFVEDMELLAELQPPSNVKSFVLQGYDSVNFPTWLEDIATRLSKLVKVGLEGLSQCHSLPPLGQLPNLKYLSLQTMPCITKIDRDFCGGHKTNAFPQLEVLKILDMENLEEWSTTKYSCADGSGNKFMFPNLERLTIAWCPKLRVGPCPPRVKDTWTIQNSDGVLLQWTDSASHHAALVGTLQVVSCKEPMHRWKLLYHLRGLRSFRIRSCNDLSSSSDIIGFLANLQSLLLWDIEAPPHWIANCSSLKELEILFCRSASYLESIQHLKNLESMTVQGCTGLREQIEMEESKSKIRHVKKIVIDGTVLHDRDH